MRDQPLTATPCKDCRAEVERWMPVIGYEGLYEVSDHGRVRSLDRVVVGRDKVGNPHERIQPGRLMRLHPCAFGYLRVELRGLDGRAGRRSFAVHRLVLGAFVGPPLTDRHEVRHHPDPDPSNNHLANLRWGTHSENVRDTVNAGRFVSRHRNKTTCPKGHPYSGRNRRGERICHTCNRERQRIYKARQKVTSL